MRVLYSFPHKLGADRICYTAWQQVRGLVDAGVEVVLYAGALTRTVPESVEVHTTLARGRMRVPYKLIGKMRAFSLHDKIVAHQLKKIAGEIDLVHLWPCAALETIEAAKQLGVPTVLERPNAHTRFCYEVVEAECKRIGIRSPHNDYRRDNAVLEREEAEFARCDYLLCASEFAAKSFVDVGFAREKILRHRYGFDESEFFPAATERVKEQPFTALFCGVDAVRKGLHFAMEAWLSSPASKDGRFWIAGALTDEFKERFAVELSHPSIVQLGHRSDVPQLMRQADVLLMPSIEEGFGLVCAEAIAVGCVPLASDACTEMCRHSENALVHKAGDVASLLEHITKLYTDPSLLAQLRAGALKSRSDWTWTQAGRSLVAAYELGISRYKVGQADHVAEVAEKRPRATVS
jgi:glycosyltransferase involved in cell wall biosynthesis